VRGSLKSTEVRHAVHITSLCDRTRTPRYFLEHKVGRPVRFSFLGHNPITNSHFDNYTFDYMEFSVSE